MGGMGRHQLDEGTFRGVCAGAWEGLSRGMSVAHVRHDMVLRGIDADFARVVSAGVARSMRTGRPPLTPARAHVRARRRATRRGAIVGVVLTLIGVVAVALALDAWGKQAVATKAVMALAAIGVEELLRHGVAWVWWTAFGRG